MGSGGAGSLTVCDPEKMQNKQIPEDTSSGKLSTQPTVNSEIRTPHVTGLQTFVTLASFGGAPDATRKLNTQFCRGQ